MGKKSNKENKTKEIFNKIVDGVTSIIDSGEYAKFLKFSRNFHNYSFNNIVLIFSQMEEATQVAGFKAWKNMGRKIKPGSKGIQIIYPMRKKYTTKIEGQKTLLEDGKEKQEEKTVEYLTYRPTYVFDISQTVGEPMPLEDKRLQSNNMKDFFTFLNSYSPFPIIEEDEIGSAQGYWSPRNKHIVLKKSLSLDDKVSVLLHELTHALYDDFNYKEDRNLSETFVESVAFIVADYFGLDTSRCSFNYITSWADGDIKVILELGDKIQKTANNFIKKLESEYKSQNIRIAG